MKIINNLLDKDVVDNIEKTLGGDLFPWYYQNSVATDSDTTNFYFTHQIYFYGDQSNYFNAIIPILKKLKYKKLIRVKANLYPNINRVIKHPKHVDFNYPTKGALYYLNTNNGPTFVGNKKVESIKNRLLLFDASKEHNSVTCTDAKFRLNVNINYL
jgi:hypothetical protein|tara:strand:+ start:2925 stop:3395 length:471 start_codon:yes stop_codon:yes gene_type:complete